jgi:hypothetical protein
MEYEYIMEAAFDGHRLTSRWEYEMYDNFD